MKLGVDVGCGPGESTWILQPHFENVVGVDSSTSMIDDANMYNQFSNVTYRQVIYSVMPLTHQSSILKNIMFLSKTDRRAITYPTNIDL